MKTYKNQIIRFVAKQQAQLHEEEYKLESLKADEIFGRTLVSLISSGSERGGYMDCFGGSVYPVETGYALIMEVLVIGELVNHVKVGDRIFTQAPHRLYNIVTVDNAVLVPDDMMKEDAVLCRFPAVSMTAFLQSKVKPIEPAMVTGLGIVGLMCAQMLKHCGFQVYALDTNEHRRKIALECGLEDVSLELPREVQGKIGLAVECSGAEVAVFTCIDALRKGGELSSVGVPWVRGTDNYAHELLHKIFYGFLTVSSGWEWSIPRHSTEFLPGSNYGNFEKSMEWIKKGYIKVENIYQLAKPKDCDKVYQSIVNGTQPKTCTIFDWRNTDAGEDM